jgi:hypothetical protein
VRAWLAKELRKFLKLGVYEIDPDSFDFTHRRFLSVARSRGGGF